MGGAGERDRLIVVQRATVATDDRGGEVQSWSQFTRAYAKVLFGTGQERRDAAQEQASQAATFICDWTPKLGQVVPTDRLQALGAAWDITSAVPIGLSRQVHITAVRAA